MSNESIQMGHTGRRSRFPALEKKRIVEETYEKGKMRLLYRLQLYLQ